MQKLPEMSLYRPVEAKIEQLHLGGKEMDRDRYAEVIVNNALKNHPETMQYAGKGTFQVKLLKVLVAVVSHRVVVSDFEFYVFL